MRLAYILLLSGVLSAQVASVGVNPSAKSDAERTEDRSDQRGTRISSAAAPISGYLLGPGPLDLRAISTTSHALRLGDSVPVPRASKRLYLPPRQQYALVERSSNDPMAVWAIHNAETTAAPQDPTEISGAMPHPDVVVFSPRGESLLLYSQASATLQVVSHLPSEPTVSRSLSLPLDAAPKMAISDDGAVVVATLANGSMVHSSNGENWLPLQTGFSAQAMSFVPKTHDLAIGDSAQKMIVLLSNIDINSGRSYRVLAQDVQADRLSTTRGGEQVMAANLSQGQIWIIDLKTGGVSQREAMSNLKELFSLRDGYTFLLSNSEGLAVMRLAAAAQNAEVSH